MISTLLLIYVLIRDSETGNVLPCSQAGLDAFSPFLAIFSAYNALIGSGVVWNDKTRRGKSFFGHIWWNFSFLGRKTLKNHQKMSQNDVFLGSTLQKKACFLQSRFNFLQNVLEKWYGHGRKCDTLLRSCVLWFWKSRADLSVCARARALRNSMKCPKMVENHKKNRKKSIFSKKIFFE